MKSNGVWSRSAARSTTRRSISSGCRPDSATSSAPQLGRIIVFVSRSSNACARHAGSRYAASRASSGASISAANAGAMLNVNGSRRFIWNVSGRTEICGHTCPPLARAALLSSMIPSCHGKPLTVRSAVHVSGRPMRAWRP